LERGGVVTVVQDTCHIGSATRGGHSGRHAFSRGFTGRCGASRTRSQTSEAIPEATRLGSCSLSRATRPTGI
jgi:hypothetical protein